MNPWLNITPQQSRKVAKCDEYAVRQFEKKYPNELVLDLWPEPYTGNPQAAVYLLNGNPGFDPQFDPLFTQDKLYSEIIQHNLQHDFTSSLKSFTYFNDIQRDGIIHAGCDWWSLRTKKLKEALGGKDPNLFNVEFCPYHSKNLTKIPKKIDWLPSYEYTNQLIKDAIKEEKLIVVMRMKSLWLKRIPELRSYPNVLQLSNPRCTYITPNNIDFLSNGQGKEQAWRLLISKL